MADPYRVMVVCTGNICRSPMAEVVLRDRFAAAGLGDRVVVSSTGISDEETGNPIDSRAASVLAAAGYPVPLREARRITAAQARQQDLLLAMTATHARRLRSIAPEAEDRVRMVRSYDPALTAATGADLDVADPWYGDRHAFVATLDEIEAAADGVVSFVRERLPHRAV